MSLISKTISLRVPPDLIYRALKDTRLEQLFPEFFIGVTRKLSIDKINEELAFKTNTQDGQIEICLLYTSPSPRDGLLSRMPSSA